MHIQKVCVFITPKKAASQYPKRNRLCSTKYMVHGAWCFKPVILRACCFKHGTNSFETMVLKTITRS